MEKSHFAEKAALILAIIALIGALVGIISMYRHDRKARAEEYERRSEELASEQLGTEALEFSARYQERMPSDGIVCWGDEGAYGNRVGSVPGTLGHIVNDRLFSEAAEQLSAKKATNLIPTLVFPVFNLGVDGEGVREIMARAGTLPMVAGEEFVIPAGRMRVQFDITDENDNVIKFAEQRVSKIGTVSIQGIDGLLYKGEHYDATHYKLAFERARQGDEVTIAKGTPLTFESAEKYRGCIPVILVESDPEDPDRLWDNPDTGDDATEIIEDILARHRKGDEQYVVVCATEEDSACDKAFRDEFGDHYLRADKWHDEMQEADFEELAERIWDCLDGQRVFDPIRENVKQLLDELEQ